MNAIIILAIVWSLMGLGLYLYNFPTYRKILKAVREGRASTPRFPYDVLGDAKTIEFTAEGHKVRLLDGRSFFMDDRCLLRPTIGLRRAVKKAFPELKAPTVEEAWTLRGY